jgi:2-hydroxy-3-oxopropionate reductase
MGTTGPKAAREHARLLAKRGIDYLDAPVSGGVGGAEAGNLTIFVGGDVAPYERALPLLTSVGRPRRLGASGAGQAAKLVNQIIVAVNIAALAEALRVGERQGLSSTDLIEALQGGFADSTVLRQHGPRMAQRNYEPGGPCRMHLKDLRLVQELLEGDFPLLAHTSRSLQGFEQLVASGYADADHSAYFELYAALASDSSEHP